MKKFICKNCGSVNEINIKALENSDDDWLQCALPKGFEWILPSGKVTPIYGQPIYISSMGDHLTYQQYLDIYYIDPEIAYNLMRGKINARTSTMVSRQPKAKSRVSSSMRSRAWLDEDAWTA